MSEATSEQPVVEEKPQAEQESLVATEDDTAATNEEKRAANTEEPVVKAEEPVAEAEEPVAKAEKPAAATNGPAAEPEKPVAMTDEPVAEKKETAAETEESATVEEEDKPKEPPAKKRRKTGGTSARRLAALVESTFDYSSGIHEGRRNRRRSTRSSVTGWSVMGKGTPLGSIPNVVKRLEELGDRSVLFKKIWKVFAPASSVTGATAKDELLKFQGASFGVNASAGGSGSKSAWQGRVQDCFKTLPERRALLETFDIAFAKTASMEDLVDLFLDFVASPSASGRKLRDRQYTTEPLKSKRTGSLKKRASTSTSSGSDDSDKYARGWALYLREQLPKYKSKKNVSKPTKAVEEKWRSLSDATKSRWTKRATDEGVTAKKNTKKRSRKQRDEPEDEMPDSPAATTDEGSLEDQLRLAVKQVIEDPRFSGSITMGDVKSELKARFGKDVVKQNKAFIKKSVYSMLQPEEA